MSEGSYAAVNVATMNDQLERVAEDPDLPLDLLIALAELRACYEVQSEAV